MSIWTKLVNVNNLVNCNNQEIDKKIKKISVQDFKIWIKTYELILLIIVSNIEYSVNYTNQSNNIVYFITKINELNKYSLLLYFNEEWK